MKEVKKETYESPEVEVKEMNVQNVICASGGTSQYNDGDTSTWF